MHGQTSLAGSSKPCRGSRREWLIALAGGSAFRRERGKAFSKLKALLRKAAERTVEGLWNAIGMLLQTFTPTNLQITSPLPATMQSEGNPL